jgi:TonB family protein
VKRTLAIWLTIGGAVWWSAASNLAPAQTLQSFSKEGVAFSYPSDWKLTDKSTPEFQHYVLTPHQSAVVIMVVVLREPLTEQNQFTAARRQIAVPYLDKIRQSFAASKQPVAETTPCLEIAGRTVSGTRLKGQDGNEPSTAEVFATVKGHRFVSLVFMKTDKESAIADAAWVALRRTLDVARAGATDDGSLLESIVTGGVLNGRALRLPKPSYPVAARNEGAEGTVVIQVTIDEQGNVIHATPIKGHPALYRETVKAALGAKFTPTQLCEVPVKVTGVITYNFVRM